MLQVVMPVETANAAIRASQFAPFVQKVLADLKPEAAYFTETNGTRSGYIFFDMKDSTQVPAVAEPWFLAFNASVTFRPVMTPQDLADAAPGIKNAVKKYGKA